MSFTIGSLFDGSGGFPLAAFMCGGVPVWASEIEPYPIAVTKSRFPYVKHLGSVTDIDGGKVEPVDVITFGSPCQDLSVAGKRAGLKHTENGDDETTRSGLFMDAVRIIKEMREATGGKYPRFAVWENVPGAFSSNKGEDFRVVCEELIKIVEPSAVMPPVPKNGWPYSDCYCGDRWSLAYRVFDAQFWGVPQRRRRIYLVLDFGGERAGEVLFKPDGLRGYFETGRSPWQGITRNAENGVGTTDSESKCVTWGFPLGFRPENVRCYEETATTLCNGTRPGFTTGIVCMATQQGGAEIRTDDKAPTVTAAAGMSGNNQPVVCYKEQHLFENHSQDTRYKGPLDVCPMLPAQLGTGGNNTPFVVESTVYESHPMDSRIKELDGICPTVSVKWHKGAADTPLVVEERSEEMYCIDGDKIGKAERAGGSGLGIRDGDKMYTLTAKDAGTHAVAYGIGNGQANQPVMEECVGALNCMHDQQAIVLDRAFYNQGVNAQYDPQLYTDGTCPTIVAKGPAAVCVRYIVRRLTPTECARLQGFPDDWGHPDVKTEFTDEEYEFWVEVYETHQRINGKTPKAMNRDRLLRWYNKLHTDSSEYKMWGNGIALPNALYVMQGIADVFK